MNPGTGTRVSALRSAPAEFRDRRLVEALIQELEAALKSIASTWYPRCVDEQYGGFLCDFDYKWRPCGAQQKMLEYQARTLRLLARLAAYPGFENYRDLATHGFKYLRDVMWDHEYGGWYRMLDRSGTPLEDSTKHGHGASYCIAACAAFFELTGDPDALHFAQKGFAWMERFAHDPQFGGYYALLRRDGKLITSQQDSPNPASPRDCIGTPFGLKDANTNPDMLDAIADLAKVDSDKQLHGRFTEMLDIVVNRIVVPPGGVHMYFHPDWTPVPDFDRYGYVLNTANILARATRGRDEESRIIPLVKSMTDTLLRYGWDDENGGFYYGGSTFGRTYVEDIVVLIDGKFWWIQAEGLRALLRMALAFPDDPLAYAQQFRRLWNYIQTEIIDHRHGGWLMVGRDVVPRRTRSPKAAPWKEPSHEVLSLLECLRMLRSATR